MNERMCFDKPVQLWAARRLALGIAMTAAVAGCIAPTPHTGDSTLLEVSASPLHTASQEIEWSTIEWWREFSDPALDELIAQALSSQPNVHIAAARLERARAIAREAGSFLYPELSFGARVARIQPFDTAIRPAGIERPTVDAARATLDFSYDLDFWNQNRNRLRAAVNELAAMEAELHGTRNIITAAVSATYFQLRAEMRQAELARIALDRKQQLLQLTQDRQRSGLDAANHVTQAQVETAAAQAQVVRAEHQVSVLRHQLAALLGCEPGSVSTTVHSLESSSALLVLPGILPADLLGRRPDIVASRERVEAAARIVEVARADFMPNVNLFALIGLDALDPVDFFSKTHRAWSAGAALRLPIFDGGRLEARLDARAHEYEIAVEVYNATVLNALREVADALAALTAAEENLVAAAAAAQSAADTHALALDRYGNGLSGFAIVLTAEHARLTHEAALIRAHERRLLGLVQTFKALGGGYEAARDVVHW